MLAWLLQNTVLAALLAIGVALICRWKRVSPALRHALWVLVLLRLLVPPGILHWPWALPLTLPAESAPAAEIAAAPAAPAAPHVEGTLEGIEIRRIEFADAPIARAAAAEPEVEPAAAGSALRWWVVAWWAVLGVWVTGAAVVAACHLHGLLKLLAVVRRSEPAPAAVLRHVGEMAAKLSIRSPRVRIVAGLGSPLIAGLIRPVLLWPKELQHRLSEDGLKAVLVHELAHLRRHDHWVRWVEMAAGCLWWWNPLFRLARRRVRQYAELACDAWVLAVLPRARRAYAEALLQVCESVSTEAEPAPALGVGGDPNDFQRRLTMIMREKVSCRLPRRALLALGVVALLAVPGWTLGDPPAPPADKIEVKEPIRDVVLDLHTVEAGDILVELLDLDVQRLRTLPDPDKKLAEIEAQLQALLKEIQALKAERAAKKPADTRESAALALSQLARRNELLAKERATTAATLARVAEEKLKSELPLRARTTRSGSTAPTTDVILHRVSYSLPKTKADALAKFLTDAVKGTILECSVDGDKLTVTTTPENQNVIGRLIHLIQDGPAAPARK